VLRTELADLMREQQQVGKAFVADGAHLFARALQDIFRRRIAACGNQARGQLLVDEFGQLLDGRCGVRGCGS
jgi:hypothetical protein